MIKIETILETANGKIIHGDNLEVLDTLGDNSIDNCISDFPYDLSFMGKKWDNTGNFYEWNKARAEKLLRVIKHGGYVAIFGHPKTNHRMKCAFEDVGFKIVEEIDWIYGSGFPKNQDIGKLFDKEAGAEREVIGKRIHPTLKNVPNVKSRAFQVESLNSDKNMESWDLTAPSTDLAKKWNGWKTNGLKPAHETITIFQKPRIGKYIDNIKQYGCGAMNIDGCRVKMSQSDIDTINAKASKNPTTNYSDSEERIYGAYAKDMSMPANENGRFPSNVIFDDDMGERLDLQSGDCFSGSEKYGIDKECNSCYWTKKEWKQESPKRTEGKGASRYFLNINFNDEDFVPFIYCAKPSKKEKGEGNTHVTVKPIKLIKWLIKLLTPIDGTTIDITAGSCTHAVACEELNKSDEYNLKYINIEMMNTKEEPYCSVGKMRVEAV